MIVSAQNRTIKDIRRLRRCKGDHALLEGPHLLREAVACGLPLETVLMTPAFAGGEGAALATALPRPPLLVDPRLLAGLCDADAPRGALALARLPRPGVEGLPRRPGGVYLYLDRLQDPGNLGAVARVAEALGAAGLALASDTVDPNHQRALRASAGSLLRLPVVIGVVPAALDRHLAAPDGAPAAPTEPPDRPPEAATPQWVALAPRGGEPPPHGLTAATVVLAVGAEGPGLTPAVAERATLRWTVPLAPPVESLNVAVAAALALWEVARARRAVARRGRATAGGGDAARGARSGS